MDRNWKRGAMTGLILLIALREYNVRNMLIKVSCNE
jgi:hypothetical protein